MNKNVFTFNFILQDSELGRTSGIYFGYIGNNSLSPEISQEKS